MLHDSLISIECLLPYFLFRHNTEPLLEEFSNRRLVRIHEIASVLTSFNLVASSSSAFSLHVPLNL